MSTIKQLLETNFYNEQTDQFEQGYVKTIGEAVITSDGKNVEQKLEETATAIETAKAEAISSAENAAETLKADILGGVSEDGNTLSKIYGQVETVKAVLETDNEDFDTIREITEYIKENRDDINAIGTSKVDKTSVTADLNVAETTEGKILDARAGKALKDSIDTVKSLAEQAQETAEAAAPIVSVSVPQNPRAGQLWFKPVGIVQA